MTYRNTESQMNPNYPAYYHTQRGPWCVLLYLSSLVFFSVGWSIRHEPGVPFLMAMMGLLMLALAPCFHHLTVADAGKHLEIRFGPVPLFLKRIVYDEIQQIDVDRTTLLDGCGIHLSLRGGWVWNIWGRNCVVVYDQGITRIGTNDIEGLVAALKLKASRLDS